MLNPYAAEIKRFHKERPLFVRTSLMLHIVSTDEDPVLLPPFDTLRALLDVWIPDPVPFFRPANLKRVMKELNDIEREASERFSLSPVDRDDLSLWRASIVGPPQSPYEGGIFNVDIKIPQDYPFKPPKVRVTTKVFHPCIDLHGNLSFAILSQDWSPALKISKVLVTLCDLLENPDPYSPLNLDAATLFKKDRKEYDDMARLWTQKYAL